MIMLEYTRVTGGKVLVVLSAIEAIINNYERGSLILLKSGAEILVTEQYDHIKQQVGNIHENNDFRIT